MNPIPEPQHYIDAQAQAMGDGLRDTVLITPGSPLPSFVPDGAKVYYTRRGIVLTTDPRKAKMIDSGSDEDVSMALFGFKSKQDGTETDALVARNQQGIPIAEVALNSDNMRSAINGLLRMTPPNGLLEIVPKQNAVLSRIGLLGEP